MLVEFCTRIENFTSLQDKIDDTGTELLSIWQNTPLCIMAQVKFVLLMKLLP